MVVALVGTKADLECAREVSREEAESLHTALFEETSAATGAHVEELFGALSERLPRETRTPCGPRVGGLRRCLQLFLHCFQ